MSQALVSLSDAGVVGSNAFAGALASLFKMSEIDLDGTLLLNKSTDPDGSKVMVSGWRKDPFCNNFWDIRINESSVDVGPNDGVAVLFLLGCL